MTDPTEDDAREAAAPLTHRLRRETARHHRAVERTDFLRALASGSLSRPLYCRYLRSLHPLYRALESSLSRRGPVVDRLREPGLARTGRLAADLEALQGPRWREETAPVPTARDYARRLEEVGTDAPHRLAAHCYLRYMGDLSGGRMLRDAAARVLGLEGEAAAGEEAAEGLAFYAYPGLPEAPEAFRDRYRRRFDRLELTGSEQGELVEEAIRGYERHAGIFAELMEGAAGPG